MYVLRLISAVLHRELGPAVTDAALDLRPGELAIIVPLVACLLALSAWPAAITGHSFGGRRGGRQPREPLAPATPASSTVDGRTCCAPPG